MIGGFGADRVGWAFCAGYQAALHALVPALPDDRVAAICVTEVDGNRPRAIRTTLERDGDTGWRLSGAKRWTTLGPEGSVFLVAARDAGSDGERPAILMARVDSGAPGVRVDTMPPTRFVPEVPHARLTFDAVAIASSDLLPGDGYTRYVKPFRTVEDIHVLAAVVGYLVREGRRLAWPAAWIERALGLLVALGGASQADPTAVTTHLALAGMYTSAGDVVQAANTHWAVAADVDARARWSRDRALLEVAAGVRAARTTAAWTRASRPAAPAGAGVQ